MADPTPEKSEEIERIDAKEQVLDRLVELAEGKVLGASTTAEAQEAIYEILFFNLALLQLEGIKLRLLGRKPEVGQYGRWAVESHRALEAIDEGDWIMAKDEAMVDIWNALQGSSDVPELMQLDRNLNHRGKEIFSRENFNFEEPDVLIEDFLHEKIALVPDKTEPYQHPNLEILKAQLASI